MVMKTVQDQNREALAMLGETGELRRVAALALIYPTSADSLDGWVVRAYVTARECTEVTGFMGPTAKERAMEYASEKYAGVKMVDIYGRPA